MGARTGSQFLEGLRKTRREIWVDGERIDDVTTHPKLSGGAESLAAMFDRQHAYAAECLYKDPETGEPTNVSHMIPRSKDELRQRHAGTRAAVGRLDGHHGPHARLHEHEVRRLRLGAQGVGRRRRAQRARRAQHRGLPAPSRPGRHLAHPYDHPAHHRQADRQPDPRQQGDGAQGRPDGRRHHRPRRPRAGHAGALRRRADGLSGPTDPGRRDRIRAGLRPAARHARPEIPVPRFGGDAGGRSVRQAAVVALRRAGCLLHLRRRAGAVGPHLHRRRRRDLQLDARRPATPST